MALTLETTYKTITDLLSVEFCWRKSYDRGAGKIAGCASSYESRGAMCYPKCGGNTYRSNLDIEYCQTHCPSGTTDIGLHCRTNGHTYWRKPCCHRHCKYRCGWRRTCRWCCRPSACCGSCRSGFTNTGCTCEPSWTAQGRAYSPGKTKFDNGATGCSEPSYPDKKQTPLGQFCYPIPKAGYQCQLTACQQKCPPHMVSCGLGACALTAGNCASNIASMVIESSMAVVSTALIVASFGTATPAVGVGKAAAKTVVKASVQKAFKTGAKSALKSYQKSLAKDAVQKSLMKKVKDKLQVEVVKKFAKEVASEFLSNAAEVAVQETVAAFAKKSEDDMENFDYAEFDPTGVLGAASTTLDKDSSDIEEAAAWTEAVGTFDPTGWVGAAATFMHESCSV